jgi:hypothetical protein
VRVVLCDERDLVTFTQSVGDVGQFNLLLTEFATLRPQVLCAGIHPVNLHVRCVRHQRDCANVMGFGEAGPLLDGLL